MTVILRAGPDHACDAAQRKQAIIDELAENGVFWHDLIEDVGEKLHEVPPIVLEVAARVSVARHLHVFVRFDRVLHSDELRAELVLHRAVRRRQQPNVRERFSAVGIADCRDVVVGDLASAARRRVELRRLFGDLGAGGVREGGGGTRVRPGAEEASGAALAFVLLLVPVGEVALLAIVAFVVAHRGVLRAYPECGDGPAVGPMCVGGLIRCGALFGCPLFCIVIFLS